MTLPSSVVGSVWEEDRLPVLIPVARQVGPQALDLFLGNRIAAERPDLLYGAGITSTMNVALNIDVMPLDLPDGTVVRRTKIGLIDGDGNTASHLLAAVLALHGVLAQKSPGKPHYPPHRTGNILVHCRGGRSRSVMVLALYLTLFFPDSFQSLDEALTSLRQLRGLDESYPLQAMNTLARELLDNQIHRLLPII